MLNTSIHKSINKLSAVALLLSLMTAIPVSAATNASASSCTAQSGATSPTVLELYTSEGCDSCPPADRWFSKTLAGGSGAADNIVALSFHVDYWDYIGWKDEFAKPAYGARHAALVKSAAASGVYTPQVFVNGRDDRTWTSGQGPRATGTPATVAVKAQASWRGDELLVAGSVSGLNGNDTARNNVARLRYAYAENGLVTAVKAGENRGVTLKHDAVVRDHGSVQAKADGTFAAIAKIPASVKRAQSTLHIIAENQVGQALAAVSMRCE
jgi:hypothetical protein